MESRVFAPVSNNSGENYMPRRKKIYLKRNPFKRKNRNPFK